MTTSGTSDESDESLAYDAAQGDDDAFAKLWRRHEDRLHRRIAARLSVHVRRLWPVDDVLQEVWIGVWTALRASWCDAPRAPGRFRNLVNCISRFKELDALRGFYRRELQVALPEGVANQEASPEERYRGKDLLLRIDYLVDLLPAKERLAYVLNVIRGMSSFEIGKMLGVTMRTIQRRVFDAKQRLIRWLGEWF